MFAASLRQEIHGRARKENNPNLIVKFLYYEVHEDIENAIIREKQLKKWKRIWKLELIEEKNSEWRDLYVDICK